MDLEMVLLQTKEAIFPTLVSRHKTIYSENLQGFLQKTFADPKLTTLLALLQARKSIS